MYRCPFLQQMMIQLLVFPLMVEGLIARPLRGRLSTTPWGSSISASSRPFGPANGERGFAVHLALSLKNESNKDGNKADSEDDKANNMIGFDLNSLKMSQLGNLLPFMCGVAVVAAIVFEFMHRRCADVNLEVPPEYGDEAHVHSLNRMCSGIWPLVRPYFFQEGTNRPWLYLASMMSLGLWNLFLGLIFTLWHKEFWDIIQNKRGDEFLRVMSEFVLLATTMIVVGVYQSYVGMMLVIHWRRFMTRWFLQHWLEKKTYYQLQITETSSILDNPDQRIQEDINLFIPSLLSLVAGFAESIGQFVANLPLLLLLSPTQAFGVFYCPGWLLYVALLYSGMGTAAAQEIGKRLIPINFILQKYEADFRYNIMQVRDHAESIALYSSEEVERLRMNQRFDFIAHTWWMLMLHTKRLQFFTFFYMQTSVTFPYLVLAPNYFKGQISLGTMFMLFRAFASVKGSFDWIIHSYPTLTEFRATADRLGNFQAAVENRKVANSIEKLDDLQEESSSDVVFLARGVNAWLPPKGGSRNIWRNAELEVKEKEFVLLTASEGSGKSCFFRTVGGIWPFADGRIYSVGKTLFVPQKPHIPHGSLKQALSYPDNADVFSDATVVSAIHQVGLKRILDNGADLSTEANWSLILSGGEQQRLAMAHAVLRRPDLLFLDEATSAVGDDGALELYALLRKPGTLPDGAAVISISHDVTLLRPVHDSCYAYDQENGAWLKTWQSDRSLDTGGERQVEHEKSVSV